MLEGDAELKIKKHRNGKLETISFKTNLAVQRFYSLSDYNSSQRVGNYISRQEADRRLTIETPPPSADDDTDNLPF